MSENKNKTKKPSLEDGDKFERGIRNFANGLFGGFMEAPRGPSGAGTHYPDLTKNPNQVPQKKDTHIIGERINDTTRAGQQAIKEAAQANPPNGSPQEGADFTNRRGERNLEKQNYLTAILNNEEHYKSVLQSPELARLRKGSPEYNAEVKKLYNAKEINVDKDFARGTGNSLVDAIKREYEGKTLTLGELTNIANVQNLAQRAGKNTKQTKEAFAKGGIYTLKIGGNTYELNLDGDISSEVQRIREASKGAGGSDNPFRGVDFAFPMEEEPEPESEPKETLDLAMPEIQKGYQAEGGYQRGYGLKDVGLIGGHVTNAELAEQAAGMKLARFQQEEEAYKNALGINLDDKKHELDLRANQLAASIVHLDPEEQKIRRMEFEQSILQDAQFNPKAAETPLEAKARYAMLDDLFKDVEKQVQRQSFEAQKDQTLADVDSGITAIQARIATGDYKNTPEQAIRDTFSRIGKASQFLSPLQRARLVRQSLNGTAEASIQQRLSDIFEQQAGAPIYTTAELTGELTKYLNTLYGVAKGYGLNEDEMAAFAIQATAQAEGAATQIKKYNEKIIDSYQAKYDYYENQGYTAAAAGVAAQWAPVYKRLAESGNLTTEAAYKQRNYFSPIVAKSSGGFSSGYISNDVSKLFQQYQAYYEGDGIAPDLHEIYDQAITNAKEYAIKNKITMTDFEVADTVRDAILKEISKNKNKTGAGYLGDQFLTAKDLKAIEVAMLGNDDSEEKKAEVSARLSAIQRTLDTQILDILLNGDKSTKDDRDAISMLKSRALAGSMTFFVQNMKLDDETPIVKQSEAKEGLSHIYDVAQTGAGVEHYKNEPLMRDSYTALMSYAGKKLGISNDDLEITQQGKDLYLLDRNADGKTVYKIIKNKNGKIEFQELVFGENNTYIKPKSTGYYPIGEPIRF